MHQAALEELCDDWLAAWTGNDPDLLLSFYTPDAAYTDPARPAGLRGHAQLRPYLTRLLAAYPTWTWKRTGLWPLEGARGFVVQHEATIPLPGQPALTERCMDLVLLDAEGRIARNDVYFDRAKWLAAVGASPK